MSLKSSRWEWNKKISTEKQQTGETDVGPKNCAYIELSTAAP